MNKNLLSFCRDAYDIMRLRYYPIEHYRYSLPVFLAVILGVGLVNAVMMKPLFGGGEPIIWLGIVLTLLRWLLLTRATTSIFHRFGSPRLPFLGYTLLTEALTLPLLLLYYLPETAFILQIWYFWSFWAQLLGFAKISQQPISKVLIAYTVYAFTFIIIGSIIMQLFFIAGWLNIDDIQQHLEQFLQHTTP